MCALVTGVQTCALPICASARGDGAVDVAVPAGGEIARVEAVEGGVELPAGRRLPGDVAARIERAAGRGRAQRLQHHAAVAAAAVELHACVLAIRSEEHTSELQSLMRISYAVFCLKKKKKKNR